jgi:glycosyltransferase involved in cell wall biosynthesis
VGRDRVDARAPRLAHLTTVDMSLRYLLATELRADVAAGFEVFGISAPGPHVAAVEALGVTHVPVPALIRAWDVRADLAAARQLARALADLDADVLHTHNPKTGVLGRLAGRLARVPVVVNTCHGLWTQPDDPWARKLAVHGAEALAAQLSHAELYQSDTDRQALRPLVRQHKARTVGNGVDLERFRRDDAARATARAELGVGTDEVLVGGVGRLVAEKGVSEFAAAAAALDGAARFVWVGPADADKPDALADKPDALGGAGDAVTWLGERDDMAALYNAFDVFVLPSWREGFSRSAMEAAACGCAMVLSDIRGCRELGCHGQQLLLVAPGDTAGLTEAVRGLVTDGCRREQLARAGEQRARRSFDQRAVARSSLQAYRDAALRRRRPGGPGGRGHRRRPRRRRRRR